MGKDFLHRDFSLGGVNITQRALFAKHFSVMVKSGMTVTEALAVAESSSQGVLKNTLGQVAKAVDSGRSLAASLAEHPRVFSNLLIQSVYAGETSGTLSENLEKVAEQLEKEKELIAKIRGAMIYPIVVLVAAFFLAMGVSFFILPKIIPLFEGFHTTLPVTTRALIAFSHLMEQSGVAIFVGTIAFVTALFIVARQSFAKPLTHWLLLHMPIVKNISRSANLARMTRTLGTMIKSGISIDKALEITRDTVGNYYYKKSLEEAARRVAMGAKLSDSFEAHAQLYPLIVTRMVHVGEESGRFEETLLYLADFYEAEVDTATKALATAIEPILLLVIGVVVGGLALAIITPIYEITGNIRR